LSGRPSAYEFKKKGKDVPIPGLVFLNAEGKVVGTDALKTTKQLLEKMNDLTK